MQLKHLFVFLLVLFLSVAESIVYSQESTSNYYQSYKKIQNKNFSYRKTKRVVFNKTFSGSFFLAIFFPGILQKNVFQNKIRLTIKLQKQLYQKIANLNNQHTFLLYKITSGNSISHLYIT